MEQEFKGTKGDWYTIVDHKVTYISNKNRVLVAEVNNHNTPGFSTPSIEAARHNANLIKSAPDLLKSLQSLQTQFTEMVNDEGITLDAGDISVLNQSKDAIEKALK